VLSVKLSAPVTETPEPYASVSMYPQPFHHHNYIPPDADGVTVGLNSINDLTAKAQQLGGGATEDLFLVLV
jgi:hypothetical protein